MYFMSSNEIPVKLQVFHALKTLKLKEVLNYVVECLQSSNFMLHPAHLLISVISVPYKMYAYTLLISEVRCLCTVFSKYIYTSQMFDFVPGSSIVMAFQIKYDPSIILSGTGTVP